MNEYRSHVPAIVLLCLGLVVAVPARAASLQKVNQSEWWAGVAGLPSYVNMYIYVPDNPATKPPIVVAPHHCQGNGQMTYNEMSSLVSIANRNGFIMIFPEATGQNCWDAGSNRSLKHDGGGDTHAIVQMVRYTLSKYGGDASRVYSVGGSSGGIMTEALLGVYPDVFMAGVSLMGVPCGCWAENYNDITGTGSSAQWSGPCAGGNVTKTGQQWGELVRWYFPGYTGHRPRLQHWHGTTDTIIDYKNVAEDIKEWTNLLGLSETPTGTDTPKSGTTRQFWNNSFGYTVYETFSMAGVAHAVPFDGNAVAAYFGLNPVGDQDPETAACPGAVPGGSGTGGAGGVGGSGGAGGASGIGDSGVNDGGPGGLDATVSGSGGAGQGGSAGSGGAGGTGGIGPTGSGGVSPVGTGGSGLAGSGGAGPVGTGGTYASGGAGGQGGSSATGGSAPIGNSSSGCSCALASNTRRSSTGAITLLFAALALLLRRRKRPARG